MKKLLLLSSSRIHGGEFLQYAGQEIKNFFQKNSVDKILFIPYASHDHDEYLATAKDGFSKYVGLEIEGIHTMKDPKKAVSEAKGLFIGGGNTFLLLKNLYEKDLINTIRTRVSTGELLYMGSSAGTNVATISICTTNDMPIVFPPSFQALNLVSFNINPHYIDPVQNSTHMGETRETRIKEYHRELGMPPVVGLREGSILEIQNKKIKLHGPHTVIVFKPNEPAVECKEEKLNEILNKYL